MHPNYVTHYYRQQPFRSLTELPAEECSRVLAEMRTREKLPRRLQSEFYFDQRRRFEALMHEQFSAKGGRPERRNPHYAILGESEIWARIYPASLRIPLAALPGDCLSFTYTDSWGAFVDRDLDGNPIPRKPQYGVVYLLPELADLFGRYGWPGDRWKTEVEWEHDLYVEAQIWSDEPLRAFIAG
jgi:hypothetical protein